MKQELKLRLICIDPPALSNDGVIEFGLQDTQHTLRAGAPLSNGALQFDFAVEVQTTDVVRFSGALVHGTKDAPFVYLGLRPTQTGAAWIKRIKVTLKGITPAQVRAAIDNDTPLQATVSGQGAASVPLLEGWA